MKALNFVLLPLLLSLEVLALPLPKNFRSPVQLPPGFTAAYDFEGIISLSNCSGSLIRFENSKDTDKAMVLTNGHCLETGMPAPGTVVYNRPSTRRMNLLKANGTNAGAVQAQKIMYSTMTNTDMTIYQLKQTYAEIQTSMAVRPLLLASTHPETQTEIEVISGYWGRGYRCAVEAFIPTLKEDRWICKDSIRYSRPGCEVIGGTSGSPIIDARTRHVIGVNNTGNEDGDRCTINNPCEISEDGTISAVKGYSYGQQTYWVYSCLTEQNEIDLAKQGCLLPR
jgi:V8-like Glu-specific endopeptidase